MTIKTCEEYVLNELNNEINKNERLYKEIEGLEQENEKLEKQNNKLMDLIKIFIKKGEFKQYEYNQEDIYYSLFLHPYGEVESKAIEELIKIKEQLENE